MKYFLMLIFFPFVMGNAFDPPLRDLLQDIILHECKVLVCEEWHALFVCLSPVSVVCSIKRITRS